MDQHNKRGDRKEDEMDRGMAATSQYRTLEPGSSSKAEGKTAASEEQQSVLRCDTSRPGAEERQPVLLYDASRPGAVMVKISGNETEVNVQTDAPVIIGPTTIISDSHASARQNEMDCLDHFRSDNRSLFVSTKAFVESAAVLDKDHVLVVTGAPGMGKTFICQQLLLQVCDEKQCSPFQPTKPKYYLKWCNTRERQAFLMNDVFGASSFNQAKYDAWMNVFPMMIQHLKSMNTYLLFACREDILNSHLTVLKTTGIFNNVINLSDDKYQLTEINKREMFLNHTSTFKIDIKYGELENAEPQGRDPIGFPQRIHFFCSMVNVSNVTRMRYFINPMEYLSTVIGTYREDDHVAYCVLILLLLHDGHLPVSFFEYSNESSEQLRRCLDICHIPTTTKGALTDKADDLCNSLLLFVNDRYVYQHPSVMEAVTLDFGQRHPSDILNSCSVHFLLERVFTQTSAPPDNEYVVRLQPVMVPQLCARLVKEIAECIVHHKVDTRSLASYAVFKDDAVVQLFLSHLQDATSLHLLLASSSPDSPHPTFLFLAAASGQDALVCEVLSCDVQQLPGFSDHLDRVLYAACYSGSPTAVRALLVAGARADYRTAHAPDAMRHGRWWDGTTTCTTLMHAAYSGSAEVLRLVLDHLQQQGMDVVEHLGIRDNKGMTALHWWAEGGRGAADTLQILLEAGAAIDARDDEGHTALSCSAWLCDEAAICALLEAGADVHISSHDGTSLQGTLHRSNTAAANLILSRMDPDDLDSWSAQTLGNHLVTKDSAPADGKRVVVLHPEKFPQLSARLVKEIRRCVCAEGEGSPCEGDALLSSSDGDPRSLHSVSTCHVFKDPAFLRVFLRHLQDAASLHLLLASSSRCSPHPTFLFIAAASGQDALVCEVLSSCDVQQLPGFSDHLDRVLYAACYSGSPAAVRALLVAGALADYRTALAPYAVRDGWRLWTTTCTTLMHAAYSGSAEVMKLIIYRLQQQGEDVVEQLSIRDDQGRTALNWWAVGGRGAADTLQILLEAGAAIDARNDNGQTALNCSAWRGDEATVCALLEAGADVHISSDDMTSLQVTLRGGRTAAANLLLSRMDPDDLDSWSAQTLGNHLVTKDSAPADDKHVVVLHPEKFPQLSARMVKEIRRCVCAEGEGSPCERDALSSSSDGDPRSLHSLSTCRVFKDPAFLRVFLHHLHDVASLHLLLASSSPDSPHPTFLFLAAASGQDALVCEVLSSCDVQQLPGFSDHLDRVLYAACCSGSPAAVRALLVAGARADYRTAHAPDAVKGGWWWQTTTCTTLMHAAYSGSAEVLRLVLDHLQQQRVDVVEQLSIRDDKGKTALHWWADEGRGAADTLQILLEAGAAIDARDDKGQTALNCSARLSDEATICALLEAGADVHINSYFGTSLQVTVRGGHTAAANLLLSRMDPDDLDSWSAQTLGNHLVTKDSAPADAKHVVVLHPEKFPQLSARLVKEIRRCVCAEGEGSPREGDALSSSSDGDPRSLRSLSASRMFKDPAFLRVFLRHLQDAASLHLLLTSSSRCSPHLTFLFVAAASGQDALVCEVLSSCDVQQLPGFSDHLDRVLYAACCSGSPAAVRALLAAGARVDYRTAHAPDEVRHGPWMMTTTCTTLVHAAYSGSADVLRLVLDHLQQQRVDVVEQLSIRDDKGKTALHWWADGGRGADVLQILLEAGAAIDARDDNGQTALNCSAWRGDEATVCALLEAGADVHINSDFGTSLQVTVRGGHTAAANLLLSRMDPDDLDSWSAQTLGNHLVTKDSAPADGKHVVVLHPEKFPQLSARLVKEIRRCVCAEGEGSPGEGDALSSSSDGDHRTLRSLSTCHVFKDPAFLRVFLHHLHDTASLHLLLASSSRHRPHVTFLFLAAASGHDALVCEVLSSCDVQQLPGFSDHLDRVLYAACCSGSPAAVRALLAAGALVDYRTAHAPDAVRGGRWVMTWMMTTTCTTLMHAAYSGSAEVVRLIIDHLQQQGVDMLEQLSIRDDKGKTALHWWVEGGRGAADTLQILLEAGAAIDARDYEGQTPLHQDAEIGRTAITRLLVKAGADVHLRASSSGYRSYTDLTPLEVTVLRGHTDIAAFLRSLASK